MRGHTCALVTQTRPSTGSETWSRWLCSVSTIMVTTVTVENIALWVRAEQPGHGTLYLFSVAKETLELQMSICLSTIAQNAYIEPIDHQAYWPSSLSTIEHIDHWAYQPLSLLTIEPINHWVYRPSSLSTIKPIHHQAHWPSSLLTIESIDHQAYRILILLTTEHWAYQPFCSRLLSLLACFPQHFMLVFVIMSPCGSSIVWESPNTIPTPYRGI